MRDLLGLAETVPATALPPDNIAEKFTSNVVRPVQGADLDRYADVAGQLAKKAVANLAMLVPCAPPPRATPPVAKNFISQGFAARGVPPAAGADGIERLEKVYTAGGGFENGVRPGDRSGAAVAEVPAA